ncbi:EpsG family protein [Prochlorococcus sp. MIT 1341]|uniref:EpsG family protein n=1 Tax=Prochlorococcus sp. MIT 1341 TaxID=3096221 RepID=UPI002A74DC27|nr:EpsG family protein [Prochlorococcus sp. MIT 1341]
MLPYFLVWAYLGAQAVTEKGRWSQNTILRLIIFFTILIGCRHEVGGDWFNYVRELGYLKQEDFPTFSEFIKLPEQGFYLLSWIGANWFGEIYLVNLISAFVFSLGLILFCNDQPKPWLALLTAFPYLVIVVAMGYTRQGLAVGVEMIAILALQKEKLLTFLGWISFGSIFHRTILAILLLPAVTISPSLKFSKLVRTALLVLASYGLYVKVFEPIFHKWLLYYAAMESQGAYIRVGICLFYALIFLLTQNRYQLSNLSLRIWRILALGAVAAAIGLLVGLPSTMVDRMALYLIPLQMVVASHLPFQGTFRLSPSLWTKILALISLLILTVWISLGTYSMFWVPYKNFLLPLYLLPI